MGYAAMTFWLYSEAVMKPADIEAVLTDWGKCQWELVAFLPAQEKGSDQYRAIFKRPDDSNDGPEEERDFVHNEIKGLRESLLTAFQMIRQKTALVCDLATVLSPLVKAVVHEDEEEYGDLSLGEAYRKCADELAEEQNQIRLETLKPIDAAILRLKAK